MSSMSKQAQDYEAAKGAMAVAQNAVPELPISFETQLRCRTILVDGVADTSADVHERTGAYREEHASE